MNSIKILLVITVAGLAFAMFIPNDSSRLAEGLAFIPEAKAVAGTHRRTRRRSVAVGYSAGKTSAQASQAQQQQAQGTAAQQPVEPPAAEQAPVITGPLAEGTVVNELPGGCAQVTSGNVVYEHCGDNYFRSAFQGSQLVYVVVAAPAA